MPDTFPPEQDVVDSIALPWTSPKTLNTKGEIQNMELWFDRMDQYVNRLATQVPQIKPAAHWRTLVLFYPHTDTDYLTLENETRHFTGSLRLPQVQKAVAGLQKWPQTVHQLSGGNCQMDLDLKVIQRPVTFNKIFDRIGFQHPAFEGDCLEEKKLYFDPNPYDCVIVLYHPGPIPQDLGGSGGSNGIYAIQNIPFTDNIDSLLFIMTHEWIHGLDKYFMPRGYNGRGIHHLYALGRGNNDYSPNWHAALLQGRILDLNASPYAYSRAVWRSGSISHPLRGPLPVRLLTPLPGAIVPVGASLRFNWNPAGGVGNVKPGYRFRLYSTDRLSEPLLTQDTAAPYCFVEAERLPAGAYVWTVQSRGVGQELSPVGESFPIYVKAAAEVAPIQISPIQQAAEPFIVSGDRAVMPEVSVSASSPCGIRAVYAEITYPDGRIQRSPLGLRSPNGDEPVWEARLAVRDLPSTPALCPVQIVAEDHAGRTASVTAQSLIIQSSLSFGAYRTNNAALPMKGRLLNPRFLAEGQDTKTIKSAVFEPVPALGGIYPLHMLLDWDRGKWTDIVWVDVTAPDGTADRIPLRKWIQFNGMLHGLYLFPPNVTGKAVQWNFEFVARNDQGDIGKTPPFIIWQEGNTPSADSSTTPGGPEKRDQMGKDPIRAGEHELQGVVTKHGQRSFVIQADTLITADGLGSMLSPPRPKTISFAGQIPAIGTRVRVIGKASSSKAVMKARMVI